MPGLRPADGQGMEILAKLGFRQSTSFSRDGLRCKLTRDMERVTNTGGESHEQIRYLTDEEAAATFDHNAWRLLGISGEEFLKQWDSGEYENPDDRSEHGPQIMRLAAMIPLVRHKAGYR